MLTNLVLVDTVTGERTPVRLVDPAVVFADVIAERAALAESAGKPAGAYLAGDRPGRSHPAVAAALAAAKPKRGALPYPAGGGA
jgi:hypothetical protein